MCLSCLACSCMRPRYKKLVDNIFPPVPQEGLVKNNMEKLTFYALSSPEKLDRIGEYLYQRASRDISRRRTGFVVIAMEAMDQLLVACHAQTLNLFVESFLRMVQKLLESTEPDLQVLATQSFVRFANIEEDTPSYHRRYDFFVSKFSSMCHSSNASMETRLLLRRAGIRGLQGVIRKTVSDDLVENIWEPSHMDKILPSLLFNMQESPPDPDQSDPGFLAEACVRELVGRASFGNVRNVLKPILRHLDLHGLWVPNDFAVRVFTIVMFSVQSQYSYTVVEGLMGHLDENVESGGEVKRSIAEVLGRIMRISGEESVGPSVLEVVNSLLAHVRASVGRSDPTEAAFRESLVATLGEFTVSLPDYQKVEIMVFIISKVPLDSSPGDTQLQETLLQSLLTVGRRHTTLNINTTLPFSLLDPLLRLCTQGSSSITLLVQDILHALLDRHGNAPLLVPPSLDLPPLQFPETSRADTIFIRKYGDEIYSCLVESLTMSPLEPIYATLALIGVELVTGPTMMSYLNMVMEVQEGGLASVSLPETDKGRMLIMSLCLMNLIGEALRVQPLQEYTQEVIQHRKSEGHAYLLPSGGELPPATKLTPNTISASCLIQKTKLLECLQSVGLDTSSAPRSLSHRHSWVEATGVTMRGSVTELNSTDVDSANSTPGVQRKWAEEEVSFEAMKRALADPSEDVKREAKTRQEEIFNTFRKTAFEDILSQTTREDLLHTKLLELFNKSPAPFGAPHPPPVLDVLFPELFAY